MANGSAYPQADSDRPAFPSAADQYQQPRSSHSSALPVGVRHSFGSRQLTLKQSPSGRLLNGSVLPMSDRAEQPGSGSAPPAAPAATDALQVRFETGECVISGNKPCAPDQVGQDLCLVLPLASNRLFTAVFDGHGKQGHMVAHMTREIFRQHANRVALSSPSNLCEAFEQLFRHAQRTFESDEGANHSGTTVTAAIIDSVAQTVRCAHVGDSKAIVACGTCLEFETQDHDFDQADMQRVASCGGEVREFPAAMKTVRRVYGKPSPNGTPSNYPALALSRSIGDTDAHKWGVLADPSVSDSLPFKVGNLLVIASDGVWNVLSKDKVLSLATEGSAEEAARQVVQEAKESWPSLGTDYVDDISVIVVKAVPVLPTADPGQSANLQPMDALRTMAFPTRSTTLRLGSDSLGHTWQGGRFSTDFCFPVGPTAQLPTARLSTARTLAGGTQFSGTPTSGTPTALTGRGMDALASSWRSGRPASTLHTLPAAMGGQSPTAGAVFDNSAGRVCRTLRNCHSIEDADAAWIGSGNAQRCIGDLL